MTRPDKHGARSSDPAGDCGEIYYGHLDRGEISGMDWSIPRRCNQPKGHDGGHWWDRDKASEGETDAYQTYEPDDVRAGLAQSGAKRTDARVTEQDAMAEITLWLRRGQGVLSITEMSRLSGVTRETIYQILRPTNAKPTICR